MTQTAPETEALSFGEKTAINALFALLYDEARAVGRHGIYETMFRAMHQAYAPTLQALSAKVAEMEGERDEARAELRVEKQMLEFANANVIGLTEARYAEHTRAETAEAQVTTLTEAVEREREECAKVVDQQIRELERLGEQAFKGLIHDLRHVAAAIRTRTHTERKGP